MANYLELFFLTSDGIPIQAPMIFAFQTSSKHILKKHHDVMHLQLKRFFCGECEYATYHNHRLANHVNAHHVPEAEKPFVCSECGAGFGYVKNLKRHVNTAHNGLKEHKCDLCEFRSARKASVKKHVKAVHKK
jgi:uncharacterized Zn-finger protein